MAPRDELAIVGVKPSAPIAHEQAARAVGEQFLIFRRHDNAQPRDAASGRDAENR